VRLQIATFVLPPLFLGVSALLCRWTAGRLLYPPDVGSEGKDVIDLEQESKEAIGMVIQRDQFPDRLFAPPRRTALMHDNANPVYDKEIHAELFSQGTLMLRLVIQISMLLAIPLMAVTLFYQPPNLSAWYICYALVFNILVAPVFSAGALTSERERQTLELLLTTVLSPRQIMWGKLLAGFRVSYVLTMFLMWPVVLAFFLAFEFYHSIWLSVLTFFLIVFVAAVFNSVSAMLCSALCRRTSVAMLTSYSLLIALYFLPVAAWYLGTNVSEDAGLLQGLRWLGISSPLMAAFWVPLESGFALPEIRQGWILVLSYFGLSLGLIGAMFALASLVLRYRLGMTGR
jgi:ABC-type transport system involved in multi-copper enzyme maturation permease subunit